MEKLVINGGHRLSGREKISGAKNAVLPIIAATLLGQEQSNRLDEVPSLDDVYTIAEVIRELGVEARYDETEH
ncbi:MAG: UDP-N-acetylglucosamine 1-carboxyvinyltransferase, partial [Schwartzia sp.]|nr:UDP-N-acetylglucosamine 1-carboxyvinyltransferase [Schwartzia sp. (in: firmicutes)]